MAFVELSSTLPKPKTISISEVTVYSNPDPDVPSEIAAYNQYIWIVARNVTPYEISRTADYCEAGHWSSQDPTLVPYAVNGFGVQKSGSIWAGVSGGASFAIALDGTHQYNFSLGFTTSWGGASKCSVIEGSNAEDAYNKAEETGFTITSTDAYNAKDENGDTRKFRFRISSTPGVNPMALFIKLVFE